MARESKTFVSTQIKEAIYDDIALDLIVTFKTESRYKYMNVPKEKWTEMKKAESVGKFLNSQIKPFYQVQQIPS